MAKSKKSSNMPGAVKGLGTFSRLTKDDHAFAKKPRTSFQSPKGKIKVVETLTTSEPSFKGSTAFRPLSGGGKIRKYYAG